MTPHPAFSNLSLEVAVIVTLAVVFAAATCPRPRHRLAFAAYRPIENDTSRETALGAGVASCRLKKPCFTNWTDDGRCTRPCVLTLIGFSSRPERPCPSFMP
jgi:hypothetical protein